MGVKSTLHVQRPAVPEAGVLPRVHREVQEFIEVLDGILAQGEGAFTDAHRKVIAEAVGCLLFMPLAPKVRFAVARVGLTNAATTLVQDRFEVLLADANALARAHARTTVLAD